MRNGPELKPTSDRQGLAGQNTAASETDDGPVFRTTRGVLTAAEIEALLRPKPSQLALDTPPVPNSITPRETPDFSAAPLPEESEEWRRGQGLAARVSMALGSGAGIKAAVNVSAAVKMPRAQLSSLLTGKSSAVACLGPAETDIQALVCLPPLLADAIIAKACGARGSTGRIGDGWTLSAIDCALLEQLLESFGPAVAGDLKVQSIETDVPYVSSLLSATDVTITEFTIEAPGLHTELAVIETHSGSMAQFEQSAESPSAPITALATARLARLSVPLSRVTALKAGSTLLLGLPVDQPIELLSGGRDGTAAYEGRMGRKGNKMALKVTKRIRSFSED